MTNPHTCVALLVLSWDTCNHIFIWISHVCVLVMYVDCHVYGLFMYMDQSESRKAQVSQRRAERDTRFDNTNLLVHFNNRNRFLYILITEIFIWNFYTLLVNFDNRNRQNKIDVKKFIRFLYILITEIDNTKIKEPNPHTNPHTWLIHIHD